jgi:hypothetical protein
MSDSIKKIIPSELRLSQKWDHVGWLFVTKPAFGFMICGLASLVVFSEFHFLNL